MTQRDRRQSGSAGLILGGGSARSDSWPVHRHSSDWILLGGFSLRAADRAVHLPGTAQRLLAFVALQRRPVAREHVAFTLWPDGSEAHAHGSLRTALFELRRPGHDLLRVVDGNAFLAPDVVVDLDKMLSLVEMIRAHERHAALSAIETDLLEADLLPGWYDDWVVAHQERHRDLRIDALERLCQAQMDAGRYADAVSTGSAAVRLTRRVSSSTMLDHRRVSGDGQRRPGGRLVPTSRRPPARARSRPVASNDRADRQHRRNANAGLTPRSALFAERPHTEPVWTLGEG